MPVRNDVPEVVSTRSVCSNDPPALMVQILGPLRLWRDGEELDAGPKQQRCLLTLLLARVGQPIGMSEMVDLLWADTPPSSAVNIIHKYIGALRRLLEPQRASRGTSTWLVRHGNGYRFAANADILDLANFYRLIDLARAAARAGEPQRALAMYQDGLELWSGLVGCDLAESAAAAAVFSAVDQELVEAALEAADLALREDQPGRLLVLLRRVASWHPLNEHLHARLIVLLGVAGCQLEAQSGYDAICRRLVDDLGLDPGPELRLAREQVLAIAGSTSLGGGGQREDPVSGHYSPPTSPAPETNWAPELLVRPAQLPPALPMFVGRESETEFVLELQEQRCRQSPAGPLVVALYGMSGVGKSTLAVHLAHTLAPRYADGQLFVSLGGFGQVGEGLSTREALTALLQSLGVPARCVPDQMNALIGMFRSLTAEKSLIILLDNARSIQQVRPLIPSSGRGVVIVTSRAPMPGLAVQEGAYLLPIDLPSEDAAREMLIRRLQASTQVPDVTVIDEIVELCGRLPLALALVAARVAARPRSALDAAVAELRQRSTRLAVFPQDAGQNDPKSIYTWCYRQLSGPAARLFRLLSAGIGPTISPRACASLLGADPATISSVLSELTESALIAEVAPGRYSSHVLIRDYAEELFLSIDSAEERDQAGARLVAHYWHSSQAALMALRPEHRPIEPVSPMSGVAPDNPRSVEEAAAWFEAEHLVLMAAVHRASDPRCGVEEWLLALNSQQLFSALGRSDDLVRGRSHCVDLLVDPVRHPETS